MNYRSIRREQPAPMNPLSVSAPLPVRKECHITDLFFRSELIQLAGSDAGDRWFREQSRGATLSRYNVLVSNGAIRTPTSPRSKQCASSSSTRPAGSDSPISDSKLPNQDISNFSFMSMDDVDCLPIHLESSKLLQCQECGHDIGLLFTDAAHTVLTRLRITKQ